MEPKQIEDASLKKLIYEANEIDHDEWANTHDSNVPYISRQKTRNYYWSKIISTVHEKKIDLRNKNILEVGCGTGTYTDLFLEEKIKKYIGIDLSPKMINKAINKHIQKNVSFVVSSLENFSIHNQNEFDIIYSTSFLHHLPNVKEGLDEIKKMLKPGGIYIGLHEPINFRDHDFIEELDVHLMNIIGYGGAKKISLYKRIFSFFKFITAQALKKKFTFNNKSTSNDQINYIDYQLNQPFRLTNYSNDEINTSTYKFLGYIELIPFMKNDNYQMIVLTKNENCNS